MSVNIVDLLDPIVFQILSTDVYGLISVLMWAIAMIIMFRDGGTDTGVWYAFVKYAGWSGAITLGLFLFIIPGLVLYILFVKWHGVFPNTVALIFGPIGWAYGATRGWYD